MSDIFRGENTISRRTLTPNLIGCFPPGSTNQRRALAAIPAASACVRSSSLDSIEDKRIVLSIQELRMKERESLDVCSMCLDTTRAGWKRVKRVNSSPLLYYCLLSPILFAPTTSKSHGVVVVTEAFHFKSPRFLFQTTREMRRRQEQRNFFLSNIEYQSFSYSIRNIRSLMVPR